jgi:hypothetical protein
VDLGAGTSVYQDVTVQLGAPKSTDTGMVLPISWVPAGRRRFLPAFAGELEATEAREGTSLQVRGIYSVPFGRLGALADRVIGGRLAQRSIDDFVQRVSARVEAEVQHRLTSPLTRATSVLTDTRCERPETYLG